MVKEYLTSHKRIYDYVHGFIRFDDFEKKLIDSLAFQRLHYVRQLGMSYLVFPGATHTRFEHSLGVMELSSRIYHRICKTVRPDLFHLVPRKGSADYIYWKKVLRLAALCHDLGHLPFSHVAETELLGEGGHEKITFEILNSNYLESVWDKLQQRPCFQRKVGGNIKEDVIKITIGEEKLKLFNPKIKLSPWERILSEIINGDYFGADRIDYLLRDSKCTGIVYGLFDYLQLIEMMRILPVNDLTLGIDENGFESSEALLLARYFMHKRVYQHSSIKSYNFHLKRFMRNEYANDKNFLNVDNYLHTSDVDVLSAISIAAKDKTHPAHYDAKCVFYRSGRFKAIDLPDNIKEKKLLDFKNKHHIEDDKIEWEFQIKNNIQEDLSFPVARRHLIIKNAKECSPILSSCPSFKKNWLYLSPEFELLFLETIK
jgi:HD superfamily phosphohydrolase